MTLDELQALVDKMTPGKWHLNEGGNIFSDLVPVHCREEYYPSALTDEDTAAVIALKNNANALLECVRLLIESIPADNASADYDDRVAAALKHFE